MFSWIKSWFKKRDVSSWRTAVAAVRREYTGVPLTEVTAGDAPFALFETWFSEAAAQSLFDANAFVLSTSQNGQPHSRVVLLKGYDEGGFVFYTNYDSDKGNEIAENPNVAMNFSWPESFRQLRIEGEAVKITANESDAYFNSRPAESNMSAVISPQSRVVSSREELEDALNNLKDSLSDGSLKRPESWGGFRIVPKRYEFWQGRTGRLHDRIVFVKDAAGPNGWKKMRLAP